MDAASACPAIAIANWYFFNPYHVVMYLHLNRPLAQCCDKRKNRKLNPKRQGYESEIRLLNFFWFFQERTLPTFILVNPLTYTCCFKQRLDVKADRARNFTEAISIYITLNELSPKLSLEIKWEDLLRFIVSVSLLFPFSWNICSNS